MENLRAIMAFVPMIWLLISLGVLKISTHKACFVATVLTMILALIVFDMPAIFLGQSIIEGAIYAILSICWIIVSALLVYNITLKTGALEIIKTMLTNISNDRRIQALIIGFAFGGFLEAVAGFGTAVAIPTGILIAMGFHPLKAALVCLVSNTVPVAFGVLGVPIISLAETSGLGMGQLTFYVCIQLFPFAMLLPLLVVYIVTDNVKKLKGAIIPALLSGITFALAQTVVAVYIGVGLAAVSGALGALLVLIIWCKFAESKNVYRFENDEDIKNSTDKIETKEAIVAWSPYILILVLIVLVQFLPFANGSPFLLEKQFYFGEGAKSLKFNWLTNGGTLLFIVAFVSGLIQGSNIKNIFITLKETLIQVKTSILTIVLVVVFAKIMTYSGMIAVSASLIASVSGKLFPFLSPVIGALGTFITGSDTSSNILFGGLQQQTAANLDMNQYWITAGNGSGATAGKMISPQSISIAAASTNNATKESEMMGSSIKYCIFYVVLMGVLVFVGEMFV